MLLALEGDRLAVLASPTTSFSATEIRAAAWCFLKGGKHGGYVVDGLWETCFDYVNQCRTCGLGGMQITPIRLERVPKLAEGVVLELVNLWGPLFTTEETHATVFAGYGVSTTPVHDKNGRPVNGMVQLKMPEFDPGRIQHRVESCPACGRQKYWTEIVGFFPKLEHYPTGVCGTSTRPFGGGAGLSVWYPTFVGGMLKEELLATRVKCQLWPVAE